MSIALLAGVILVVGLGERLDEVVAYDSLFYIQESDIYVRAEKEVDSSAVYLYFSKGKEPDVNDSEDVVRDFRETVHIRCGGDEDKAGKDSDS